LGSQLINSKNVASIITPSDPQIYYSSYCDNNCTTNLEEQSLKPIEVVKIVDLMGREVKDISNTVLIYIYSDGTSEKVFRID
jgi:hypothetical protein